MDEQGMFEVLLDVDDEILASIQNYRDAVSRLVQEATGDDSIIV